MIQMSLDKNSTPPCKLYLNDLNGNLIRWQRDNTQIAEDYRLIVRTIYKFTDLNCTRLLIIQIRFLLNKFANGDREYFISEQTSDGLQYFRFSNDANLSINITPLKSENSYLATFSAGVESE